MAISEELIEFVRDALARGVPRSQVEDVLLRAGWSRDQVASALAHFAEVDFPVPVPRPKPYLSAREAFMYLLLFSTLYISAYNLGVLLFHYIDRAFPDAAVQTWTEYTRQSVRWALSSLIVSFPVFLYMSVVVGRSVRLDPAKRRSNVRRWLTYLTLFAAASVLIGDFITLVYNLLGGELTTRFVLKVLTIGTIAGAIFGHYLADLRLEETKPRPEGGRWTRVVGGLSIVAVVAVIGPGIVLLGWPSEERAHRLDDRRVADLREISRAADLYFTRHGRPPSSLDELAREPGINIDSQDPIAGGLYEYRLTGTNTYELCANFQRESGARLGRAGSDFWSHGAGRQCFQLEAKAIR